ncbi:hypothetical protein B0H13DRAFT_54050 [Mycena leptocephala]|nr:hypothetical protein B0H13DRAFT_54050 [Mycena leptocephala]
MPTKTSSAAAPPPAPARTRNCPKDLTPPTQIYIHKDTIPTRINTSARPRHRTTPSTPAHIPPAPTTAAACTAIRQQWWIPRRTRQHTAPSLRPSYQPGVPMPAPHRPTNAQVAMSQQEKPGQQWRRSASPAPPPHSHALLQSGPPALRAGVTGNGDANGNGIEEAGEEDDEESELPWARCVFLPSPPLFSSCVIFFSFPFSHLGGSYMLWLEDALAPLTSWEAYHDMPISRPLHPRSCAGALVPCLHHHHSYREPRMHVPTPTDVIRYASRFIHLVSPCSRGSEVSWGTRWLYTARSSRASTVEARRGAGLDGGQATSGVRARGSNDKRKRYHLQKFFSEGW